MKPRTLDVSHLPNTAWDEASPLWWGNLLLTFIETTTLMISAIGSPCSPAPAT